VDDVAKRMFSDLKDEIKDMHNVTLKRASQTLLTNAQRQHSGYRRQIRATKAKINPALQGVNDQVPS
jgi:hypothetical protein